ncbi:MAG: MYG1 family protein [Simkaniaceae bacterium]|nr:MYG1 family protein [Candidatus Sacchlamyda saccharinae]
MIPRSLGTHDGSFHADEVSACALLLAFDLIDKDKIVRSRDPEKLSQCEYVCDVGGLYDPNTKRFDHHQLSYTGEYSSAGMVWQYLRDQKIIDDSLYEFIRQAAIIGVDAHDNGKVMQEDGVATFSHVIAGFVPVHYDAKEEEQTEAFFVALDFALGFFQRLLKRYEYTESCGDIVAKAMEPKEKVLLFDEAIPWQKKFFDLGGEKHPAQFILMPAGAHWKLRGIPPNPEDKMGVRMPLPKEWAGLRDEELQKVSGVPGAIFCHKGRFISIWETKEDAQKALAVVFK